MTMPDTTDPRHATPEPETADAPADATTHALADFLHNPADEDAHAAFAQALDAERAQLDRDDIDFMLRVLEDDSEFAASEECATWLREHPEFAASEEFATFLRNHPDVAAACRQTL